MKEKLKATLRRAGAALKQYLARAKQIVTRAETFAHAVAVAAIGGGVDAVYMHWKETGTVLLHTQDLATAKLHFVSGAILAVGAWLKAAPALHPKTETPAAVK